jgi:endonuclease/exonuclease/phosphatase family metal-dependent hydrolase
MNNRPNNSTQNEPKRKNLKIYQLNVNTSKYAQHDTLNGISPAEWDIIAIQEPAYSSLGLAIGITSHWHTVYPTTHRTNRNLRPRSIILVNKKIATNSWKSIEIDSRDVTIVELQSTQGPIQLINVYNNGEHNETITALDHRLTKQASATKTIMMGDFNRHHPLWDEARNEHLFTDAKLADAQFLIDLIDKHKLVMALPPGLPTHELSTTKNHSRLDNVFIDSLLAEQVTKCTATPTTRTISTDHFPIETIIQLEHPKAKTVERRNFRQVDWDKFREKLTIELADTRASALTNIEDFEARREKITKAIQNTIQELVPLSRLSAHSKRWWNKELSIKRKQRNNLANRAARKGPHDKIHEEQRKANK